MTVFTRRQTIGLLIAGATATLIPGRGVAETADTFAQHLSEALNAQLGVNSGMRFDVVKFELSGTGNSVAMHSVVQLDWPPGTRRRPFHSTGPNQQKAIKAMFQECLDKFDDVWPVRV